MEKNTLKEKLIRYSGAAGAVLAGGAVQGQVLYTDYTPDSVATGELDFVLMDINQDNVPDFGFITRDFVYGADAIGAAIVAPYYPTGARVAGSTPSSFNYALKLNANDPIGSSTPFLASYTSGTMAFTVNGTSPYNENWNGGVTDGFIGVSLDVSGNTHYAWIRCDVSADAKTVTVKDAGINLTAGASIPAGAQVVSVVENLKANVKMVNDGKTVRLTVSEEMGRYNLQVIDITGRTLINEDVEAGEYTVNTAGLPAGTYIINTRFGDEILSRRFTLR